MNNSEFFLVPHTLSINLEPVDKIGLPVDSCAFENEIPAPFKMSSDLSQADASILSPLKLNNDNTQALWGYLQAQNQKINALLTYVLTQQDDPKYHNKTLQFSAGSFITIPNTTWAIGDSARVKIFLPEESSAIYCYAVVSEINNSEHTFKYTFIREQDQELLIRASLHIQTQQLKDRAKLRELNN